MNIMLFYVSGLIRKTVVLITKCFLVLKKKNFRSLLRRIFVQMNDDLLTLPLGSLVIMRNLGHKHA